VIGINEKGSRSDERVCAIETTQGWSLMVDTTEPGQQWKHDRAVVVSNLALQMASVSVSSFREDGRERMISEGIERKGTRQ
jgi:hypothetical protein